MSSPFPFYLGGEWVTKNKTIRVTSPYDDSETSIVAAAEPDDYSRAVELAAESFIQMRRLSSFAKETACLEIAAGIENARDTLARVITLEAGKTIRESQAEVSRAVGVFRTCAEEAKRIGGELIDLDWTAGNENRVGLVRRVPMGVIAGITPFNFPLNLVAHKVGPAIASGNCIVVKPASKTPQTALMLARIIDQSSLPKGAVSVLPGSAENASALIDDERVALISFTGSDAVGWGIKKRAWRKKVVLELGGNAGVIVAEDASIDWATTRLVTGAFGVAGQSCISVQRIFIHENIFEKTVKSLTEKTKALVIGDPLVQSTDIGAMIDKAAVDRAMALIGDALKSGAKLLTGGKSLGPVISPTLITLDDSSPELLNCEAFAPVATVQPYKDFASAIAMLNDTRFGLQAGVFSNRLDFIRQAFRDINCGGVIINDIPTWRADHMPYGGMKDSGVGREGVRYAMESMTDLKLLALPGHDR